MKSHTHTDSENRSECPARLEAAESHKPEFRWVVDQDGERWIYDGATPVAALHEPTPEEPTHPHWPICFHEVRLQPNGPVAFARNEFAGPIALSWRKHFICNMGIDSLEVNTDDTRRLRLAVVMSDRPTNLSDVKQRQLERAGYDVTGHESGGRLVERTWLELGYDPETGSYVFDIQSEAKPAPGWEGWFDNLNPRGVEFGDLLPAQCNDRYPPHGNKRYDYFYYKGEDGRVRYSPMNHHLGPEDRDLHYAPDGFQMFGVEEDVNPVIEFKEGLGSEIHSELCWAMYDVHYKFKPGIQAERLKAGEPLRVHYAIYGLDAERARLIADQAAPDPKLDDPMVDAPIYAPGEVQRFEPTDAYLQPTDLFSWQKSDPSCVWDRETGYQALGALSIRRDAARQTPRSEIFSVPHDLRTDGAERSQWEAMLGWRGEPMSRRQRVRVMVRTQNVEGVVRIGWQFLDGPEGPLPPEFSEPIHGDTEWQALELLTSEPPKPSRAIVALMLEGRGSCWLDEFVVEPINA